MSTSRAVVERSLFSRVFMGTESVLPFIPKPVKYLVLLIFLLNYKSWPFVWHIRVWYYALSAKLLGLRIGPKQYYHLLGLDTAAHRALIASRSPADARVPNSANATTARDLGVYQGLKGENGLSRTREGLRKVGRVENPLLIREVLKGYAGFDDCDYNMHLSNSAYAKNLDIARMKACIEYFSPAFPPGAVMALAASHYHFIKEIPIFAEYEIRMGIQGYEEKWIYLVAEFVTYPKKSKNPKPPQPLLPTRPTTSLNPIPSISQPGSGTSTPTAPTTTKPFIRADGSILHCLAVSTYCFKLGRITIPTRVALSFSGFGKPENWERAERLLAGKDKGRAWLAGGWREEKEPVGAEFDVSLFEEAGEGDGEERGAEVMRALKRGVEEGGRLKRGLEGMRGCMEDSAGL